ncbi:related to acyl-CoA thiolesterase [Fusarium fujikuroi]|nr:related to acyl-CoA thiolesterase [Fusarium fujikuroi]
MSQSLIAAKQTVGEDFVCHSLQSQFFLLGSDKSPVTYSVARVREGRSYATRTVHATQEGKCIHLAVVSFARTPSKKPQHIHHASGMAAVGKPPAEERHMCQKQGIDAIAPDMLAVSFGDDSTPPQDRVLRCWIRAREDILHADDITVHQAVLVFLSDWLAIATAPYAHGYFRFPESIAESVKSSILVGTEIGMLSTLNHSICFHSSSSIRADEWMLVEVNCPWAGDERCLAIAKVFTKDGALLASYTQESRMPHLCLLSPELEDAKTILYTTADMIKVLGSEAPRLLEQDLAAPIIAATAGLAQLYVSFLIDKEMRSGNFDKASLYSRVYETGAMRQILATFTASGPGGDVTRAVKPQLWSSPENWEGTIWHALAQMKRPG